MYVRHVANSIFGPMADILVNTWCIHKNIFVKCVFVISGSASTVCKPVECDGEECPK